MATQQITDLKTQGNLWKVHSFWYSHKLWLGGLFTNQQIVDLINNY